MTGLRVGLAYVVAVAVGAAVWRLLGERNVLRTRPAANGHQHGPSAARHNLLLDVLVHASHDFLVIGSTLVVGAGLAAVINSGFSRTAMEPLAGNPFAAVAGMSLLAVLLNLCSEADAFVASSFYAFPVPAKLAFLVLGPMVDLKLMAMYTTIFRPKAIVIIMGLVTLLVFVLCVTGYVWMAWIAGLAAG